MAAITITIEVDAVKKNICIKDDAGNEKHLQSVIVCGGDATTKKFYLFGWGSPADAGWALATSFKATSDPFYKRVFVHFSQWIATFLGFETKEKNYIDGEELAEMWEKLDAERDKNKWN